MIKKILARLDMKPDAFNPPFLLTMLLLVLIIVGTRLLSFRFVPDFGWGLGLYYSIFHSISCFNQTGFTLFPGSLSRYAGDPIVNLTIRSLITLGGIGFTVLVELISGKKFRKLSLHSQVMLTGTLVINVVAVLAIFFIEYGNPGTLGQMNRGDKL